MRSEREISNMMDKAIAVIETLGSDVPGMSYEEGVENGLRWVLEHTDDEPIETDV